jgi:hypothetical protein
MKTRIVDSKFSAQSQNVDTWDWSVIMPRGTGDLHMDGPVVRPWSRHSLDWYPAGYLSTDYKKG